MRFSRTEGIPFSLLDLALLTTMIAMTGSGEAAFIDKQSNSASLNLTNSWVGGVVPRTNDVARWRSIVTVANTTDLGANLVWDGLSIANPGGAVTINSAAGNSLTIGGSGVDMNLATRDLILTCGIQLGATQTWTVATGRLLTLSGGLGGLTNVALTKAGSGGLILNETSSAFTGLIVVSNGFLGGTGVLSGPLLIAPGGTLTPGNPVGHITVNNQLILQGIVRMEMSKGAGAIPADMVGGLNSLTYGGALIVSNTTASLLAEGDSVRLFAAASYSGAFTSMSLPALSSWLSWDTSRLVKDGTIRVVAAGPPYIVIQPGNTTGSRGQSASITVAAAGKQPLAYRWFKDGNPLTSSAAATLILTNLQPTDAGPYQVVVSNAFGSVTSQVATLVVNLATLDSFNVSVNGEVCAIAVQADGKTLLGGNFGTVAGQEHSKLARLNADGSVDTTFKAEADGRICSLVALADGKILVAGDMLELCGQRRHGIGRLNADGSLDQAFDPNPNSSLYSIAVQADGRLVVAGNFSPIGGQSPLTLRD